MSPLPVTSFVKFISTSDLENITLGFLATSEPVVEGLKQGFQDGVVATHECSLRENSR